jgi:hypothetical protein
MRGMSEQALVEATACCMGCLAWRRSRRRNSERSTKAIDERWNSITGHHMTPGARGSIARDAATGACL